MHDSLWFLLCLLICGRVCLTSTATESKDEVARIPQVQEPPSELPSDADEDNPRQPTETQKAVCSVTAGEVRASAEAVTTKTLKGVCGSAEMQAAFHDLEAKLYGELVELRAMLKQLMAQQGLAVRLPESPVLKETKPKMIQGVDDDNNNITTNRPPIQSQPISSPTVPMKILKPLPVGPKLKSLPSSHAATGSRKGDDSRDHEVSKFNNTLLSDREVKIFSYYWTLNNFTDHIKSGHSIAIESPMFTIRGKMLHIKAHFQHLHRDFLFLQMEHTQLSPAGAQRNSISMDMPAVDAPGSLFRAIMGEQLKFKHKITIMDQTATEGRGKDLTSPELSSLASGFLIPNSALLASPYIKDNSLLVQIFLYL